MTFRVSEMAIIALLYPNNIENTGHLKGTQCIRDKGGEIKSYRIENIGDAQAVTDITPYVERKIAERGTFPIDDGEYVVSTHLCYDKQICYEKQKIYEVWGRIDAFEDTVITYHFPGGKEYQLTDGDNRVLKFRVACKVDQILKHLPRYTKIILEYKGRSTTEFGSLISYNHDSLELHVENNSKSYKFADLISLRAI